MKPAVKLLLAGCVSIVITVGISVFSISSDSDHDQGLSFLGLVGLASLYCGIALLLASALHIVMKNIGPRLSLVLTLVALPLSVLGILILNSQSDEPVIFGPGLVAYPALGVVIAGTVRLYSTSTEGTR